MDRRELRIKEDETLKTLKKVSDHLFIMDYRYPYSIDEMLEKGVKGMLGAALSIQKLLKSPLPVVSPAAGRFGCSTFNAVNEEGHAIMGRNFDYKESDCFVVWTQPEGGYRSMGTGTLNFLIYGIKHMKLEKAKRPLRLLGTPYVTMDGINEKGLALAILEIKAKPTKQSTGKIPTIPPIALRGMLDRCANVEEAIEFFSRFDMQDLIGVNYHYFIADESGAAAIIEYVDNEMRVIRQKTPGEHIALTNYFLSEGGDNTKGRGFERYENICNKLCECGEGMSEDEAMELLSQNTLLYRHPKLPHMVDTVWSNVFDLKSRTQLTCAGMDYGKAFKFSLDRPGEYETVLRSEK